MKGSAPTRCPHCARVTLQTVATKDDGKVAIIRCSSCGRGAICGATWERPTPREAA